MGVKKGGPLPAMGRKMERLERRSVRTQPSVAEFGGGERGL